MIDADPELERFDEPEMDSHDDPGIQSFDDPVIEAVDPDPNPVTSGTSGTADPDYALAASEKDLAKLQAATRSRVIKAVALAALGLILIAFVLQNADPVGVNVLGWTVSVGLIWVIVASVLLGAVAGFLVGRPGKQILLHGPYRRQKDDLT
jgi:uncharacterized integral membrane protein